MLGRVNSLHDDPLAGEPMCPNTATTMLCCLKLVAKIYAYQLGKIPRKLKRVACHICVSFLCN